ncbi:MAG: hypothetical protein ACTSQY_03210 [Candidatus Odinarchaeia archaeon]
MAICKLCGAQIDFKINSNGKWEPFDKTGVSHFQTCPEIIRRRELYSRTREYPTKKEILAKKLGKDQTFLEDYNKEKK